jgi:SAM-dependent methyltransferase
MEQREFEAMLALDERHWWYRGRRRMLAALLHGFVPGRRVLDAGCGSGRTLDELARYGSAHGVELNPLGLAAARRRGHRVEQAPVETIPFADGSFDLVTCLDVIEHTDDDVIALRELRRVTRPGGHLVVSVPAHPRLWSRHDEVNGHRRRYTRRTLRTAAEAAGWEVERMTGFNVVYLVPAAVVRIGRRDRRVNGGSELELTPAGLDALLELPLRGEAALVRRGADLPTGLSLMAVLRRDESQMGNTGDDFRPK